MRKIKTNWRFFGVLLIPIIFMVPAVVMAQSSSNNYRLEEAYFGSGGEVDASSNSYRSLQSAGGLGVGMVSSDNYDAALGFVTQNEEFLEMAITGADVDFGTLSPSSTSYAASQGGDCSCTFYVRTYLASSYSVVTLSNPPTSEGGIVMDAKGSLGAPSVDESVEEFGINLVANTAPGNFGANLVNEPDNTFADGQVADDYDNPNQFKYGVGDTVVLAPATSGNQAIGRSNYTISYIAKASNISAAGTYIMDHVLVTIPVF